MAYSIFSFIDENQFVRAWLHRKTLSNSLRSERAKAEFKIENESASDMNVDVELQKYSGTLTSINEDLKSIHSLRDEEKRIKGELETARMELQKAIKTRKTLIKIAVYAVITIAIAVTLLVLIKPNTPVEQVEEEVVINNVQN